MDKMHPMAASFSEAKSTLDQVFRFYKWRRHTQSFPEEVYLLLSRCMYVCFSLWRSDQGNQGDFFRRSPPPTAFWIGLDFAQLQGTEPEGAPLSADARGDHFTNDTRWFEFWMKTLEQSDPRAAPIYREFSRHILACMGRQDLLDVKMGYRNRKALDLFLKKDEAGRVLLRTIAVLEDLIQAIVRYFATLDGRTCVLEKVALLTGFLSAMRQVLVWETPAKGPYSPSADARWRGRSPLTWLSRERTPGLLTVIPRREGGEILCVYSPVAHAKARHASWVRKIASVKGTYEEALFATWSYDTGEHRKYPEQFPGVAAGWTVQYAEAQRLETLARQVDLLLASLQGNPRSQRLVEAVRGVLRNGCPRWKATVLPWTYVKQLDQLLEKLTSAYREAIALGRGDAAECVLARIWGAEETPTGGAGSSRRPESPSGGASRATASQDMTLALGEVKFILPKADPEALEQPPEKPPSAEDSAEVAGKAALEQPPEEPALSEQSPEAEVETAAEEPSEEPELPELSEQNPQAEIQTPAEKSPDEAESSGEDFKAEGPAPVHEVNPIAVASDEADGLEPPSSVAAASCAAPTEPDVTQVGVPAVAEEPAPKPARRKKRTAGTNRPGEIDEDFLRRLLEHHGCLGGTLNYEPLSAAQLQRDLGWNHSKVQRALTDIFGPKPVNVYRSKCKNRTIAAFLKARAANVRRPAQQPAPV
ncbi:MAG: hypothetical protein M1376_11930 [Planctomycetes bacterium]|nr:hypothetical protein [Planctomycetota bacterium]